MHKYPNVATKLILRCGGKILMLRHKSGAFDFPGGRMEWGETPEDTLKRELAEELRLRLPRQPKLFDIWNYIARDKSRHSVFLYYFVTIKKRPRLRSTEGAAILWLSRRELRDRIRDPRFLRKLFLPASRI